MTFLPSCKILAAADNPAPPAPTTTTSVVYCASEVSTALGAFGLLRNTSGLAPAIFIALATPSITPLLVTEAPDKISTLRV